jgi:DNA primase
MWVLPPRGSHVSKPLYKTTGWKKVNGFKSSMAKDF